MTARDAQGRFVSTKGLEATSANLEQAADDVHGQPILDAMHRATLLVERDAKIFAPVDTGHLRASIASEVRVEGQGGTTVTGVVGSNVVYAPYMELGTRPHWMPIGAIQVWARRHGMNAFLVQRAIAVKGTAPRRYLQRAFEKNQPEIVAILGYAVSGIVQKANP
jgi:HK97 gp10 family phage protein